MRSIQNNVEPRAEETFSSAQKDSLEKCILLYEDDQEILFLCSKILSGNQYRVETRSKCLNVINDIETVKPHLILMDLWIPEIGGEKAISIIKENPSTSHIPVLVFSANAAIKEISEKINANGYIEKPFDINTLRQIIEKNI